MNAWTRVAKAVYLAVWFAATVVVFLPFAVNTSPLDAVMLNVPENQGNWWHVLAGAPFFLAFPMLWLRVRAISSPSELSTSALYAISVLAGLSALGTILVETPFLFHLAGTSEWQRLSIIGVGLGTVLMSGVALFVRRRWRSRARAAVMALNAAYLANAALCLVVYSDAVGGVESRFGWFVTMAIVWPMLVELIWLSLWGEAAVASAV